MFIKLVLKVTCRFESLKLERGMSREKETDKRFAFGPVAGNLYLISSGAWPRTEAPMQTTWADLHVLLRELRSESRWRREYERLWMRAATQGSAKSDAEETNANGKCLNRSQQPASMLPVRHS